MNDEEIKAIKELKEILKYWQTIVNIEDDIEREIEMNCYIEEMPFNQIKTLLNLIEKKETRIQELEKINTEHQKLNGELREEIKQLKKQKNEILDYITEE